MGKHHIHPQTDELAVFVIPADTDEKCRLEVVPHDWKAIRDIVGGYLTPWPRVPFNLECGCPTVILVDEDGLLKMSPQNTRASLYGDMVGNVVILGDAIGYWFSLPQAFNEWEGPGAPLPDQRQPWERD